jgi:hypothetical protein
MLRAKKAVFILTILGASLCNSFAVAEDLSAEAFNNRGIAKAELGQYF